MDAIGTLWSPIVSNRKPSSTGKTSSSHREGPEATPYLPNAIITNNRYRPARRLCNSDQRRSTMMISTLRNIKLPWQEIKRHPNPLWEKGYQFYCVTPEDPAPGA